MEVGVGTIVLPAWSDHAYEGPTLSRVHKQSAKSPVLVFAIAYELGSLIAVE